MDRHSLGQIIKEELQTLLSESKKRGANPAGGSRAARDESDNSEKNDHKMESQCRFVVFFRARTQGSSDAFLSISTYSYQIHLTEVRPPI